jgi:hypothetical protein
LKEGGRWLHGTPIYILKESTVINTSPMYVEGSWRHLNQAPLDEVAQASSLYIGMYKEKIVYIEIY